MMTCSCGQSDAHEIARSHTYDGIAVCLWSDGMVSGLMGFRLRGVPSRRPRTPEARENALTAGHLLLGDAGIYDADELPDLYRAAETAAREDALPGTMRDEYARIQKPATPTLIWVVLATDRDGKPTERYAKLPRLSKWPGLVIWDFCNGPGSARGRYHVMREEHPAGYADKVCYRTGCAFARLTDLWKHLEES